MIRKSFLASFLVALGVAVNLSLGPPLGPFLFSFGLLSICYLDAFLFTGKAGYLWKDAPGELGMILALNMISGWGFGRLLATIRPEFVAIAAGIVDSWGWTWTFFLESFFCGAIMFLCVELYQRKTILGIILGVPIFIFCGFQHSIANIIYLGLANSFSFVIILCIVGNLLGSIFVSEITK